MKPELRRGSAFRRAVVLPTVLLLGAGGALVASPAFADAAPTAATSTSTADPASTSTLDPSPTVTTTPTAASTPDPTPSVTSTASPAPTTPTLSPTSAPTSAPTKESAPPKTLIVTTPAIDADGDPFLVHGADRVVTIAGRAPAGSSVTVIDDEGDESGPVVADSNGDWSITVTVKPTDSYDQDFEVDATHAGHDLDPEFVEVLFDAPQSGAPVITSPVTGDTVIGEPEPFIGTDPELGADASILVSGTGTPGDDLELEADESGTNPDDGSFGGETTVGADGTWSTRVDVSFARYTLTATQQKLDDEYNPLTELSDDSNSVSVSVDEPAGYVAAPDITKPAFPDDGSDGSSSDSTSVEVAPFASDAATSQSAGVFALDRAGIPLSGGEPESRLALGSRAATSRLKARDESTPADDSGSTDPSDGSDGSGSLTPSDLDGIVASSGIEVKGTADASGSVETTVSGTGTPGDGIVIYSAKPSVALPYFVGLYPDAFVDSGIDVSASAPSTVPVDDGSITVGADGTWTATVPLSTGPLFLTAFAVDRNAPAGAAYSVAGTLLPVEVTADPAAAAAPAAATAPTLAFTGSDDRGALAVGLSALLAGGALVAVNARRRRRADGTVSDDRD